MREADELMLPRAKRESGAFHEATAWYLRGWMPLPYQYAWHQSAKLNGTWIGGIATAKTSGNAASYLMDCLAYPYFRALSTSVTQKQAELPFYMIQAWMDGNNRLEHLIEDIVLRPYPLITFKNYATWEFRTSGFDARFIRGFEYDRIAYDECALDVLGKTTETLRGRLRGTRPDGSKRLARLDTVTSPGAVLWLKERFDKGFEPKSKHLYFSMRTATWDNTHLTKDQIEAMKAEMTPEIIAVELGGEWPDYGAAFFSEKHIDACTDQSMYDTVYEELNPEDTTRIPKEGYRLEEDSRVGITLYELPYDPRRIYIVAGDFGRGNPPYRNAGVVMTADVTEKPYRLVYCNWVSGNGSTMPFLNSFKYAVEKYYPQLKGVDTTGTQAMIDEIAFENYGITTEKLNYSSDKWSMFNALQHDLSNHWWRVPPIQGLIKQSKTYMPEKDKDLAQDLVCVWAQLSFLARMVTHENGETYSYQSPYDARKMWIAKRAGRSTPRRRRR